MVTLGVRTKMSRVMLAFKELLVRGPGQKELPVIQGRIK